MKKIFALFIVLILAFMPIQAQIYSSTQIDNKTFNSINNSVKISAADTALVDIFRQGQSWMYQIKSGQLSGYSTIDKFGQNPLITTSTDPEDVTEIGGLYAFSDTSDIISLSSASAADSQNIEITGLVQSGVEYVQTIQLQGQTRVALDSALWRIYRMENVGSTDCAGIIYCYSDTANTAGVPSGASVKKAIIDDGNNQTLMAIYTIPLGKVGFLFRGEAGLSFDGGVAAGTQTARLFYQSRRYGQVFKVKKSISLVTAGSSNYQDVRSFPDPIPALTDIKINVAEVSADIGVWATLDILLVDENKLTTAYLTAIGQPSSK